MKLFTGLLNSLDRVLDKSRLDLDTLEGIEQVKIPKYQPIRGLASPAQNIEYILQKKATEHKRNGRMNLAIACLRKSSEIMPYSNFKYPITDYLRLPAFLEQTDQREEAYRDLIKLQGRDWGVTDKIRLYSYLSAFLAKSGDTVESIAYFALSYLYQRANTKALYSAAKKNKHSKEEIASLARRIKEDFSKSALGKALVDRRVPNKTVRDFIFQTDIDFLGDKAFKDKIIALISAKSAQGDDGR